MTLPLWLERLGGWLQNLLYDAEERTGTRVADITQITPQFWTGGALTTEDDVQQLVDSGITADVDCRLEYDDKSLVDGYDDLPPTPKALVVHPHVDYLYDGVADDGKPKPVSWFQFAWEFAEPLLKDGGVLLAHCSAGHNRGPSMCYFLLRAYTGMAGDEAFELIKSKRPVVTMAYRDDADEALEALGLAK